MKKYRKLEEKIIQLFKNAKNIEYENETYVIQEIGKPRPQKNKGECKTDVYLLLKNKNKEVELKLSVKMKNTYEFQESKISEQRAEQIFGDHWMKVVRNTSKKLSKEFQEQQVIYNHPKGRIKAGSVTMGWRLEILNKPRKLSVPLTEELAGKEIIDCFYKGVNMDEYKKHSIVNKKVVFNSGVANTVIITEENELLTYKDVLKKMKWLDTYTSEPLYLGFIANNYRTVEKKIDGSRPLAVYVKWSIRGKCLKPEICYDQPLKIKGKPMAKLFQRLLGDEEIIIV